MVLIRADREGDTSSASQAVDEVRSAVNYICETLLSDFLVSCMFGEVSKLLLGMILPVEELIPCLALSVRSLLTKRSCKKIFQLICRYLSSTVCKLHTITDKLVAVVSRAITISYEMSLSNYCWVDMKTTGIQINQKYVHYNSISLIVTVRKRVVPENCSPCFLYQNPHCYDASDCGVHRFHLGRCDFCTVAIQ